MVRDETTVVSAALDLSLAVLFLANLSPQFEAAIYIRSLENLHVGDNVHFPHR
jgi:hypothetical protein